MIKAFKDMEDDDCMNVVYLFIIMKMFLPPNIQAYKVNYTCFKITILQMGGAKKKLMLQMIKRDTRLTGL